MINLKILHALNIVGIVDSDSGVKYVYEKFYFIGQECIDLLGKLTNQLAKLIN